MPSANEYAKCQSCGTGFFREPGQQWKRFCLNCFFAAKNAAKSKQGNVGGTAHVAAGGMDQEMLRRLIQLCHPDKHNGSQASILATQWLLKQKEKL